MSAQAPRRVVAGRGDSDGELGIRGGKRRPRHQTSRDGKQISTIDFAQVELERHPDVGLRIELLSVEARVQDPDDDIGHITERDTSTEDRRIALKPPGPECVAQHGDRRATRPIL